MKREVGIRKLPGDFIYEGMFSLEIMTQVEDGVDMCNSVLLWKKLPGWF